MIAAFFIGCTRKQTEVVEPQIYHYQYTPVLSINPGTYILTLTQGTNKFTSKLVEGHE